MRAGAERGVGHGAGWARRDASRCPAPAAAPEPPVQRWQPQLVQTSISGSAPVPKTV